MRVSVRVCATVKCEYVYVSMGVRVCAKCVRVWSVCESEIVCVMCVCVRWCERAGVRVCFVVCM